MSTRDRLLKRIDAFLAEAGMSARQFSIAVTGDHKWLSRLRRGQVSLQSIERAEAIMAQASVSAGTPCKDGKRSAPQPEAA